MMVGFFKNRKRIINDRINRKPYLVRYYMFLRKRPSWIPFNVFLHKFLVSDPDDLHDHPWAYFTFILWGGYWEITDSGSHWRGPGHFRIRPARSLHRIELAKGKTAWSLFVPFRRVRDWGFIKDGKWIDSESYFRMREAQAAVSGS